MVNAYVYVHIHVSKFIFYSSNGPPASSLYLAEIDIIGSVQRSRLTKIEQDVASSKVDFTQLQAIRHIIARNYENTSYE